MTYILIKKAIDTFLNDIRMKCVKPPEIILTHQPAISGREEYLITMSYGDAIIKRILAPHCLTGMTEDGIIYMLNEMLDAVSKKAANTSFYGSKGWVFGFNNDLITIHRKYLPEIKRVIFSDPCTIVLWNDGTKTIVRCTDEKFDKEKGLAMCIAKKSLGNKGKYYDIFKKWIEDETK